MIPWWWAVLAFFAGTIFSFIAVALFESARTEDENRRWWKDE